MRILVTGGAGFIGSHLVDRLVALGHQVAVLDNLSTGKREYVPAGVPLYHDDIETADLGSILKEYQPEVIYHLAAQKNLRFAIANPIADATSNIIGALRLLEAARPTKPHIIFTSSAAVYGEHTEYPEEHDAFVPINPYGITKLTLEHYLEFYRRVYDLPITIFRSSNAYGPRQDPAGEAGVISLLIHCLLTGQEFVLNGDGTQTRDYTYVDDIVDALVLGLDHQGTFNLGTNRETSLLDLIATLEKHAGHSLTYRHQEAIAGEVRRFIYSAQKARAELHWEPRVTLDEGLRRTYQWQKENL